MEKSKELKEQYLILMDKFINKSGLWALFVKWMLQEGYSQDFINELENINIDGEV